MDGGKGQVERYRVERLSMIDCDVIVRESHDDVDMRNFLFEC